jgi:WD40 repeat protein
VYCVYALSEGRIVSGSKDKTIKIWNSTTGLCLLTLMGHTESVYSICELDAGRIVSVSSDNTLRVWNLSFTPPEPIFNEQEESLDKNGSVLPNCAICWEMINANRPGKNIILPCGGIFHKKCIENMKYCPICDIKI